MAMLRIWSAFISRRAGCASPFKLRSPGSPMNGTGSEVDINFQGVIIAQDRPQGEENIFTVGNGSDIIYRIWERSGVGGSKGLRVHWAWDRWSKPWQIHRSREGKIYPLGFFICIRINRYDFTLLPQRVRHSVGRSCCSNRRFNSKPPICQGGGLCRLGFIIWPKAWRRGRL